MACPCPRATATLAPGCHHYNRRASLLAALSTLPLHRSLSFAAATFTTYRKGH